MPPPNAGPNESHMFLFLGSHKHGKMKLLNGFTKYLQRCSIMFIEPLKMNSISYLKL